MIRRTQRVARKQYRCDCGYWIKPGFRYWECVASPDHGDLGNTGWWRLAECWDCSERRARQVTGAPA